MKQLVRLFSRLRRSDKERDWFLTTLNLWVPQEQKGNSDRAADYQKELDWLRGQ